MSSMTVQDIKQLIKLLREHPNVINLDELDENAILEIHADGHVIIYDEENESFEELVHRIIKEDA